MAVATCAQPGRRIPVVLCADLCGHPRGNMSRAVFPGGAPLFPHGTQCKWVLALALACSQCVLLDCAGKQLGAWWKQLRRDVLHTAPAVVCDRPRALTLQMLAHMRCCSTGRDGWMGCDACWPPWSGGPLSATVILHGFTQDSHRIRGGFAQDSRKIRSGFAADSQRIRS